MVDTKQQSGIAGKAGGVCEAAKTLSTGDAERADDSQNHLEPHTLVTGATGFLGRHIVEQLVARGLPVTAFVRSPEKARQFFASGVAVAAGDICDPESVARAFAEADSRVTHVIHAAADTSGFSRHNRRQRQINVEGTRAVVTAAKKAGVCRLIYVSTIAVFGAGKGLITEASPKLGAGSWVNYCATKCEAERIALAARAADFEVISVNPTHIVGRYDTHNWVRLIRMALADDLPGLPPGRGNFAHVVQVAAATITALKRGESGECYILGGPNHSFRDFMDELTRLTGTEIRARALPAWLMTAMAWLAAPYGMVTGKKPRLTPEEAWFATHAITASSEKAIAALDYKEVPLADQLQDCLSDMGVVCRPAGAQP